MWFEKQHLLNRCWIMTANGPLRLTVPVTHTGERQRNSSTRIAYGDRWQQVHWRALESAYRRSPYFEYYEHELAPLFEDTFETLWEFQQAWIHCLTAWARLDVSVQIAASCIDPSQAKPDLRRSFGPRPEIAPAAFRPIPYTHTFGTFHPNLSMLDLVLNLGPRSGEILKDAWQQPA